MAITVSKIEGDWHVVLDDGARFKIASNQDYDFYLLRKQSRDQDPNGNPPPPGA